MNVTECVKVVALVGKSGGGKSTLIHLLMRFYDPKEGRIILDGTDLTILNPISYRRNIGIVAQVRNRKLGVDC